jgi:hypothetical protein
MPALLAMLIYALATARDALASGTKDFTGSWEASSGGAGSFALTLTQTGSSVQGYHSAVAHRGNRIDAVLPDAAKPSITGSVVADIATVTFRSGYSSATGEATLTRSGDKLVWKITKSSGTHYLPSVSILHRR